MASPAVTKLGLWNWKRLAVACFFAGTGFALVAAAIMGAHAWYKSRPTEPRPWNYQAIKVRFNSRDFFPFLGDRYQEELERRKRRPAEKVAVPEKLKGRFAVLGKMRVQLYYDLENTTSLDYTLEPPQYSTIVSLQKLKSRGSLVDGKGLAWEIARRPSNLATDTEGKGILIPAQQTVRVLFTINYEIIDDSDLAKISDWGSSNVQKEFVQSMLEDVDSFVLLDESQRYRIELPLEDVTK
jgi:hypothetical protein